VTSESFIADGAAGATPRGAEKAKEFGLTEMEQRTEVQKNL
jgi:hypothetical protein